MTYSYIQKIKTNFSWERFAVGIILLLGFALRLRQYLTGRSLWLDEAMLALNIVNRSFEGLFQPLEYDQGAPIGFLLVEKAFNVLFGEHEFVLRFFPFVIGLAAFGLFYVLLRRTTSGLGMLIGLALFAVSPKLIYYSSEVKQYILDVAVTILLLYLAYPLFSGRSEIKYYIYLGVAGIMALWFSHPALFVLAGIGSILLLRAVHSRDRSQVGKILIMGVAWLANLGGVYLVSLRNLTQNRFLREYWQENFIPVPPWSDWSWFGTFFGGLLRDQIGMTASDWLVFLLLVLGFIALFKRNKAFAITILTISFFAVLASSLWLYPLGGRFSLFQVPLVIILISQSLDMLEQQLPAKPNWNAVIVLVAGIYLLYGPLSESFANFVYPKYYEHIRPSMSTLSENWMQGDVLFVSNGAVPAFRFYADRYGLGDVVFQTSDATEYSEPSKILSHLKLLNGKPRVWVLITHVYEKDGFNEKDFILDYLDTIGDQKREFRSAGTSVYLFLYDLAEK